MLERDGDEATLLVEPVGEGPGDGDGLRGAGGGGRLRGYGDGEVVSGDVALSGRGDTDL